MTLRWLSVGFVMLVGGLFLVGGPVLLMLMPNWFAALLGASLIAAGVIPRPLKPA